MLIALGLFVCLGSYLATRRLSRRWFGVSGVGTLSRQADESYFATAPGRRIAWRLAGPTAAYILATALGLLLLRANGVAAPTTQLVAFDQAPAFAAGLRTDDRIVSIDGSTVRDWPEVQRLVAAAGPGRAVSLSVLRADTPLSFTVTTNAEGRIGIGRLDVREPPPLGPALREAAAMPFTTAASAAASLWGDLAGTSRTELVGPVGIVRALGPERTSARTRFILALLAYPTALVWPICPLVELLLSPRRARAVA